MKKLLKKSSKNLEKNSSKFVKEFIKVIEKMIKIFEKNHQKNLPGLAKKIFFSNQTKNKCKLIFNQNKKKIIFFWDLKKFIKNRKSQDWSPR